MEGIAHPRIAGLRGGCVLQNMEGIAHPRITGLRGGCVLQNMEGIAQLVRAPGCGPGGRGFDPHYSPFIASLQ